MTEADKVSPPRPDPANEEQDGIIDEVVPDVPVETPPVSGTPLQGRNEQDSQGRERDPRGPR